MDMKNFIGLPCAALCIAMDVINLGELTFNLSSKTEMNAIYFGLVLSGYGFASINKPDNEGHIVRTVSELITVKQDFDIETMVKNNLRGQ